MSAYLFWASACFIGYVYLGYPVLVWLRALIRPRHHKRAGVTPGVSLVIAAYNEAGGIAAKIENLLALDYPAGKLEIIIASDGSQDGTDEIVSGYAGQGINLLRLPRVGKVGALNAAASAANNEILVFTDANSLFAPDTLRVLVSSFADAGVGGVCGAQRLGSRPGAGPAGIGERVYWNLENGIKVAESLAGNAISATGALYAIRRSLFSPLPPGVTDDFVNSTGVIAQGYRLAFEPRAVAHEQASPTGALEFSRKVRIITRGLNAVLFRRRLLNPFRFGFYSIQLLSHKLLRRLVFLPLLVLGVVTPLLWPQHPLYRLAGVAQGAFYGLALLGFLGGGTKLGRSKLLALPWYFVLVNAASAVGFFNLIRGRKIDRWEPSHNTAAE